MIIKPDLWKQEKPDYVTIDRYLPKQKQGKGFMKYPKADIIYIVVCSLILAGLLHSAEHTLADLFPKLSPKAVIAAQMVVTPTPKTVIKYVQLKYDARVTRLHEFLLSKNSPLTDHAGYIIKVADEHAVDWTLIVAIAGKESSYGKNVKAGCHNPFGLGGSKPLCFTTWNEAIDYEANLLSNDYRRDMIEGIQGKYCPTFECAKDWTDSVYSFAKEMLVVNAKE